MPLTTAQCVTLRRCLEAVWNDIAHDYLTLGQDENDIESAPCIDRFEYAQVCLDADRWRNQYEEEMKPIMEILQKMSDKEWKLQMIACLPYGWYGY